MLGFVTRFAKKRMNMQLSLKFDKSIPTQIAKKKEKKKKTRCNSAAGKVHVTLIIVLCSGIDPTFLFGVLYFAPLFTVPVWHLIAFL